MVRPIISFYFYAPRAANVKPVDPNLRRGATRAKIPTQGVLVVGR